MNQISFLEDPFDGRLIFNQGHHDLSVLCIRLRLHQSKIPVLNVSIDHTISLDPEKEHIF